MDTVVTDLVRRGDDLAKAGNFEEAAVLYRRALEQRAGPAQPVRIRRGLLATQSASTPALLNLLQLIEQISPNAFVGEGLATWQKTLPFMHDARFMALAEKHAHLHSLANWHWNLQVALWAIQQARTTPGDFIELGVFRGHTTLFCAEYVEFFHWPKRWLLYDTFEGIPEDQLDPGWARANSSAYHGTFSYEEVRERFSQFANIEVIRGRVPEVLVGTAPERIAFAHIDLNNSSAEIAALDFLFDRLSPGGVILLDDYGWATASAQFVAERAWFASRGLALLALPTGQAVFMKAVS